MRHHADRLALLAFVVAVVVLGGNPVGVRFSNRELAPFFGAAARFAVSSALLFAILALWRIPLPRGRALAGAVVYGVGQYFVAFALIYWGLVSVPAGMFAVAFATFPLWTLFLSAGAGYDRLRPRTIAGAVVAIGGLALIFATELRGDVPLVRVGSILGAALVGAAVSVLVKAFPRTNPVATNAVGTLVGAPLLAAVSLVAGERWALPTQTATWLAFAFLVASTIVGFVLIVYVILRWTPAAASYQVALSPVVTVALATALAGESFGPLFVAGGLVVLAGVYVGTIATASAPPRDARPGSPSPTPPGSARPPAS